VARRMEEEQAASLSRDVVTVDVSREPRDRPLGIAGNPEVGSGKPGRDGFKGHGVCEGVWRPELHRAAGSSSFRNRF